MKTIFAIGLLASAFSSFAKLPDAIICTSSAEMPELKEFLLSDIRSGEPSMNIYDVPFNENYSDKKNFSIYFSNECENSYVLTIPMKHMHELESGKRTTVTGSLDYNQYAGDDHSYEEVVTITCRKQ